MLSDFFYKSIVLFCIKHIGELNTGFRSLLLIKSQESPTIFNH